MGKGEELAQVISAGGFMGVFAGNFLFDRFTQEFYGVLSVIVLGNTIIFWAS
jgi:hypothetical protein